MAIKKPARASLTKEQIKRINEMPKPKVKATPPTKQQIAQAKARAGGNTAIISKTKPTPKPTVKPPVKKKVVIMPDKISPSKMTPAQKAEYLKNPERYDK